MATKSKKPAKRLPAKPASKRKTTAGASKTQKVISLMKRASGVTRDEVLKLTGWKAVSMQQVATSAGVTLKVDNKERPFTYHCK